MQKIGLRVQLPLQEIRLYQKELAFLTSDITEYFVDELIEKIKIDKEYTKLIRLDDFSDDLNKVFKIITIKVANRINQFLFTIKKRSHSVNVNNRTLVVKSLSNIKSDLVIPKRSKIIDAQLNGFVSQNVSLIKTIPEKLLQQVEEIILLGTKTGQSYKELSKELIKKFDIQQKRADIIAKDQILKLHGNLTFARFRSIGCDKYKWSSSKDERTRPTHLNMEAKICSLENDSIYKNSLLDDKWKQRSSINGTVSHPSEEVLCRCSPIPIIEL